MIQIMKIKAGVNRNQEDPNYDLYKLACKVTARRFFPNFLNLDSTYNKDDKWKADDPERYIHEVATMGCRTRVYANRFGEKTSVGRGNLSFTTINIVKLAIECMEIEDTTERIAAFFERLDKYLNLAAQQLYERYRFQCTALKKQFPLLMAGLWQDSDGLSMDDSVEPVLKHGTLSIGFIGLAETLIALVGKHHGESEDAQKLGLEIVSFMRRRVDEFADKYDMNYTLLGTPAEGLSGTFTRIDREKFGIIPGITDKDYYTNSSHIPVSYKCTITHKAKVEGPYHKLENAGHIFYVETDYDITKNIQAIMDINNIALANDIGYWAINHFQLRCPHCNYETVDNSVKTCPHCGSPMDYLQRITGLS